MLNPKGVLLGLVWIEGGGCVEGSRVELDENRLILSQFHSIVLPLNANRPLNLNSLNGWMIVYKSQNFPKRVFLLGWTWSSHF